MEELCKWRGTWLQGRPLWSGGQLPSQAVLQQCCFHKPHCIIIELFEPNEFSFFITPQIGDSCWHWLGGNHHCLTKLNKYQNKKWIHSSNLRKTIKLTKSRISNKISVLAGVAQRIDCQLVNQRAAGSIPSQGTCLGYRPGTQWGRVRGNHTLTFLSLSFSLPSLLSKNK